jgi:H+/Cl- antiporter ClcA
MLTFQPFATSIAFFLIILLWSGTSFSLNQNSRLSLPPRQRNGIDGYAPVAQLQHRTRNLPLVLKSSKEEQFFATDVVEPEVNAEELQVAVAAENASKLRTAASLFDYDSTYVLFASAVIGVLSGFAVAMFKLSIEALRESVYGNAFAENVVWWLIPALGGLGVGLLAKTGEFAPGLLGTANEIDDLSLNVKEDLRFKNAGRFLRKPLAAIITLGSGCSLGPEGPSVEIGMTMSRLCMPPSIQRSDMLAEVDAAARLRRNRLLLSAGAAAGVAAGFNAPLAGVFFALEILQQNLPPLTISGGAGGPLSKNQDTSWQQQVQQDYLTSGSGSITAILIASVLAALVSQVYLGEELALSVPAYQLNTPLVELPMVRSDR